MFGTRKLGKTTTQRKALLRQLSCQWVNGAGKKLVKGAMEHGLGDTPYLCIHPGLRFRKHGIHIHSGAVIRDFHAEPIFPGGGACIGIDGGEEEIFFFHVRPSSASIMPYFR